MNNTNDEKIFKKWLKDKRKESVDWDNFIHHNCLAIHYLQEAFFAGQINKKTKKIKVG